jgi:hypothetical protein
MLARIRLDFQSQRNWRSVFGVDPIDERDTTFRLLPLRFAQPRIEHVAQRVHHRASRHGSRLDEVDVL